MDGIPPCGVRDREALVAYLYDECEPAERERVEAHLAVCVRCADEVAAFRSVRGALDAWTLPEASLGLRVVSDRETRGRPWWAFAWRPGWGLAAAAVAVFAAGLLLGGVEVQYGDGALVLRAGLVDYVRSVAGTSGAGAPAAAAPAAVEPAQAAAPWRADLVALEQQLRRELAPGEVAARPGPETRAIDHDALLQQLHGLIAQSERRQQQERALWLTEFAQELDVQRRADQQQLRQELGALEGVTDYLVRVSQR